MADDDPSSTLDLLKRSVENAAMAASSRGSPTLGNGKEPPSFLAVRRPRAGTMPSRSSTSLFSPLGESASSPSKAPPPALRISPSPSSKLALGMDDNAQDAPTDNSRLSANRNRSTSLSQPSPRTLSNAFGPSLFASGWTDPRVDPLSPIGNGGELYVDDGSTTIARTLDYLGLEEAGHHSLSASAGAIRRPASETLQDLSMNEPSDTAKPVSLVSRLPHITNRVRSWSTSATNRYEGDEDSASTALGATRVHSSSGSSSASPSAGAFVAPGGVHQFHRTHSNRPRAISVGVLDSPDHRGLQPQQSTSSSAAPSRSTSPPLRYDAESVELAGTLSGLPLASSTGAEADLNNSAALHTSLSGNDLLNLLVNGVVEGGKKAPTKHSLGHIRHKFVDITDDASPVYNSRSPSPPISDTYYSSPSTGQPSLAASPSIAGTMTQNPTRSLWIGNLDRSVSADDLMRIFAPFGSIESLRVIPERECGFVNFIRLEDAVRAKEEVMGRMGGYIGGGPVRIGFGKTEAISSPSEVSGGKPTRALWIGNIPASTTSAQLHSLFSQFGAIESARILAHKNCGFVNFERVEDAIRAKKAIQGKDILGVNASIVRVGFAKVPPRNSSGSPPLSSEPEQPSSPTPSPPLQQPSQPSQQAPPPSSTQPKSQHQEQPPQHTQTQPQPPQKVGLGVEMGAMMNPSIESYHANLIMMMAAANANALQHERVIMLRELGDNDGDIDEPPRPPFNYFSMIPPVAEPNPRRRVDTVRLREMRKRFDSGHCTVKEAEAMAHECMEEIVELSSDYLGNTIVQRLFERCSENVKTRMLERIAPHLATLGVHKNGTWAAQKIIDCAKTSAQISLICTHLKPYAPPLLLDQFGNYVIQCTLRFGPARNQYAFEAMVDRLWEIAQGRFGARGMRTCLENPNASRRQQKQVAVAIIQNSLLLATNPNGSLMLTWLLDTSNLPGRYRVLAPRLAPHLAHLCTHKLASQTVLKIVNQRQDAVARNLILASLFFSPGDQVLEEVLGDQVNGVTVVQKILTGHFDEQTERQRIAEKTRQMMEKLNLQNSTVSVYKKLQEELANIPSISLTSSVTMPSLPSYYPGGIDYAALAAQSFMPSATPIVTGQPLPPASQQEQAGHTASKPAGDDKAEKPAPPSAGAATSEEESTVTSPTSAPPVQPAPVAPHAAYPQPMAWNMSPMPYPIPFPPMMPPPPMNAPYSVPRLPSGQPGIAPPYMMFPHLAAMMYAPYGGPHPIPTTSTAGYPQASPVATAPGGPPAEGGDARPEESDKKDDADKAEATSAAAEKS
ncbi:uncharacterized protein VTP21DRAFT_3608 [Calcarisporiella thermophila]|uniref:uncharacterized protein n=1 Tax=Calcarisporiella thermophila TaxID=911321 RepID=UPI003743C31D